MNGFCDSSALVKLYADEDGREVVAGLGAIAASALAAVEVPAAIWRKHRLGELYPEEAQVLTAEFEADFWGAGESEPRFGVVAVTEPVLVGAAALVARHPLRAYDALQLASALAALEAAPELDGFACFDESLRAAAAGEGLTLIP